MASSVTPAKQSSSAGSPRDASKALLLQRVPRRELELPLCSTCSTQTDYAGADLDMQSEDTGYKCPICADPRQYIGFQGQRWTTLLRLIEGRELYNDFEELIEGELWAFKTRPSFGIGQRAFLIKVPAHEGLVMWDCVAYLDDATLKRIDELSEGKGISHMIISHPHYYSTTAVWAQAFPQMTVWMAKVDFDEWYQRHDLRQAALQPEKDPVASRLRLFDLTTTPGRATTLGHGSSITILQLGGHFPGSAVLLWKDVLLIADTIQIVPSGRYKSDQPQRPGVVSVSFLWSYPNLIPLSADEVEYVCEPLEGIDFSKAYGAFEGYNILGHAKEKILASRDIILGRLRTTS